MLNIHFFEIFNLFYILYHVLQYISIYYYFELKYKSVHSTGQNASGGKSERDKNKER